VAGAARVTLVAPAPASAADASRHPLAPRGRAIERGATLTRPSNAGARRPVVAAP
jgi:hypothetical protein